MYLIPTVSSLCGVLLFLQVQLLVLLLRKSSRFRYSIVTTTTPMMMKVWSSTRGEVSLEWGFQSKCCPRLRLHRRRSHYHPLQTSKPCEPEWENFQRLMSEGYIQTTKKTQCPHTRNTCRKMKKAMQKKVKKRVGMHTSRSEREKIQKLIAKFDRCGQTQSGINCERVASKTHPDRFQPPPLNKKTFSTHRNSSANMTQAPQ